MDCSIAREAISATLDGEASDLDAATIRDHLRHCDECVEWQNRASTAHRSVRLSVASEMPDLTSAVLVAVGNQKAAPDPGLRASRWLLGLCAFLQLVTGLPALLQASGSVLHLDHELGSWDVALAFAFLIIAVQPSRAWGMLPFLAVLGGALGVTTFADIVSGVVDFSRESTHITELLGFVLTFVIARLRPRNLSQRISII